MNKFSVFVHSNYTPGNFGGIQLVVSQIIEVLSTKNVNINCFYINDSNIFPFNDPLINKYPNKVLFKFKGANFLFLGNINFIRHALRNDLVIFQEPFPTLWPAIFFLNRILKKNIIVVIHALPTGNKYLIRIYKYIRSIVFKKTTIICSSKNLLDSSSNIFSFEKYIIPLSIKKNIFYFSKNSEFDHFISKKYCLFVGRLSNYKGLDIIIQTAKELPDVLFVIAGSGELRNYISKYLESENLTNVIFINRFISEDEKFYLIDNCYLLLFPSTSINEAFGIVQLEAMRSGKAIINTNLNNGVNYVAPNNDCAITINVGCVNSLSNAITYLWYNNSICEMLGNNGRKRFLDNFTYEKFMKEYTSLFNKYLN